jgi:hypothetical protein
MLRLVLIALLVLVAALLGYAATKPDTFTVQRSITVQAPPSRVYPLVADFHRWRDWSPYEKLDPAMKRGYSGPGSGVGAAYAWDGAGPVGAGRMEIAETVPDSKISIRLDFSRPFESHCMAEFMLVPMQGDGGSATQVTWTMRGPDPYIGRLMSLFFNRDRMIGSDFELGLANLKALAER